MIRIVVRNKPLVKTGARQFCTNPTAVLSSNPFTIRKGIAYSLPVLLASGSAVAAYKYYFAKKKFIPKPSFHVSSTLIPEDTFNNTWLIQWIHRLKMFFRAIGMSSLLFTILSSGLFVYYVPFVPNFLKNLWQKYLVFCLGKAGACSTKLGQWAATRPDLFPESICHDLATLQSNAPVHKFKHTQEIIARTFYRDIDEIFVDFDTNVLASGAIAQVHRATVKSKAGDLIDVAVKIRHPYVYENVLLDLTILRAFGNFLNKFESFKWMSVKENIDNFAMNMEKQLNLQQDGINLSKFNSNFQDYSNICFPIPFLQLSNQQILIETFEEGIPISEYLSKLNTQNVNNSDKFKEELATLGITAFLKMVFIDNFIHTDLHPGNILVREKNNGAQIVFLDGGLVTSLSDRDRVNFLDLFGAVASGNVTRGIELIIERSGVAAPPQELQDKFKKEVKEVMDTVTAKTLGDVPIGRAFLRVLRSCRQCKVKIDGNFGSFLTGLIVVEGLGRQLNAKFDLLKEARPLLVTDPATVKAYLAARLNYYHKQ